MITIKNRVIKGAKHLDKMEPGWAERINLQTFEIFNCWKCILGQLKGYYSPYSVGLESYSEAEKHGLNWMIHEGEGPRLQQEWVAQIKKRRKAKA